MEASCFSVALEAISCGTFKTRRHSSRHPADACYWIYLLNVDGNAAAEMMTPRILPSQPELNAAEHPDPPLTSRGRCNTAGAARSSRKVLLARVVLPGSACTRKQLSMLQLNSIERVRTKDNETKSFKTVAMSSSSS